MGGGYFDEKEEHHARKTGYHYRGTHQTYVIAEQARSFLYWLVCSHVRFY